MKNIKCISPMLAVADMEESVGFYSNVLGFTARLGTDEYSIVERDGCTIHLMKAADDEVLKCVRGHTQIYIEVEDIESLWQLVSAQREQYKVREPFDQPYGMHEFHIEDPNGCLLFIGQVSRPQSLKERGQNPSFP